MILVGFGDVFGVAFESSRVDFKWRPSSSSRRRRRHAVPAPTDGSIDC
jgi:hypothetical protein